MAEAAGEAKGKLQQLLGIRGGSRTNDIWKIRLQLTKPVTWVPLIWGDTLHLFSSQGLVISQERCVHHT